MRMTDKVAIVTGSTRGIGQATAERLAAEGAKVVITGRTEEDGRKVEADIRGRGGDALFVRADLVNEEEIEALVNRTVEHYGKLTTLVNNAAPTEFTSEFDATFAEISNEGWDKIMLVGLTSVVWVCRHAVPKMREAGGGAIVHISSHISLRGAPGIAAYTASKGALNSMTLAMAVELASDNIRCNAVVPGVVMSGELAEAAMKNPNFSAALESMLLTPLGQPEHVANAVLFLASDEAAYTTGSQLLVEGGSTCRLPLSRPSAS